MLVGWWGILLRPVWVTRLLVVDFGFGWCLVMFMFVGLRVYLCYELGCFDVGASAGLLLRWLFVLWLFSGFVVAFNGLCVCFRLARVL